MLPVAYIPTSNGTIPLGGTGRKRHWRGNYIKVGQAAQTKPFSGPGLISVCSVLRSLSPPADHSRGHGESPLQQKGTILSMRHP